MTVPGPWSRDRESRRGVLALGIGVAFSVPVGTFVARNTTVFNRFTLVAAASDRAAVAR
ncbi:MAG: hypothetical protein ACLQFR_04660 [Streptosporangiaceae bacterium]